MNVIEWNPERKQWLLPDTPETRAALAEIIAQAACAVHAGQIKAAHDEPSTSVDQSALSNYPSC